MALKNPSSRLEQRLARALADRVGRYPIRNDLRVGEAIEAAEGANMKPVLASEAGALLLLDPCSEEHFLFKPTGPLGEYESREHVEDIVVGEPIPDRFLAETWTVLDKDWRWRVESDEVEGLAE